MAHWARPSPTNRRTGQDPGWSYPASVPGWNAVGGLTLAELERAPGAAEPVLLALNDA